MPEKGGPSGWRKRIHSRPSAVRLNTDDRILTEEDAESLRPTSERSSWRKNIHSRPATPSRAATPTSFPIEAEDVGLEMPSPRKPMKPKLARYFSGYLSIKDASKEPDFGEPWTEMPPPFAEVIDPMVSLQSVYSHMTAIPTTPIPLHFNSGLFRVFEDYRKTRTEKVRLEKLLHETFDGYRVDEESWSDAEAQYQAEIRRLELLIARGTSGMSGLMMARQGTVVKRRATHRKTTSCDPASMSAANVPVDQLDDQIRLRSRQVLLRRPVSPSSKMVALSRQFIQADAAAANNFAVGTPPKGEANMTLSRKVQSELNLAALGNLKTESSVSRSLESNFSGKGDALPDEVEPQPMMEDAPVDFDAMLALQELATLVARKKGIDSNAFLAGLSQLYAMTPKDIESKENEESCKEPSVVGLERMKDHAEDPSTPERVVRHVRSQPLLGSAQRQRRHFSFEPGDDQIVALEEKLRAWDTESPKLQSSSGKPEAVSREQQQSPLRIPPLHADAQKPSKIPSPILRPGLEIVRRESSNLSLRTALRRPCDDERRDSRSSILTAFRHDSNGNLRPESQSRSSSARTVSQGDGHQSSSVDSFEERHNSAAMAAARAVDHADNSLPRLNAAQSTSTAPTATSSAGTDDLPKKTQMENATPHERL